MEQVYSFEQFNMVLDSFDDLFVNHVFDLFVLFMSLEQNHQREVSFLFINAHFLFLVAFDMAPQRI